MLQPETRALAPWQAYPGWHRASRACCARRPALPERRRARASRPAAGGVAAPRGLLDGLAAAEIGHAVEQARATRPPTRGDELHPIATTIVQAALDDTAAGFLRSAVVAIDHPVLDLLTSSFLDPALAQSIRAEVEARVHDLLRALHEGGSLAAGRERTAARAREWSQRELGQRLRTLSLRLRNAEDALVPAVQRATGSRWDELRGRLTAEVQRGPRLAADDAPARLLHPHFRYGSAADELARLQRTSADLARLRREATNAPHVWREAEFHAYLIDHPEMAALWAVAVDRGASESHVERDLKVSASRGLNAYLGDKAAPLVSAALAASVAMAVSARYPVRGGASPARAPIPPRRAGGRR